MTGAIGEWVNDLAKQFNASQKDYKIVPTYKGSYDESMTAAIAAFRAGNAPHILQVFEVGTATMMATKGADHAGRQGDEGRRREVRPERLHPGRGRLLHGAQRPDAELPVQQLDHRLLLQQGRLQGGRPRPRQGADHLARGGAGRRQAQGHAATSARSPPAGQAGRSWKASRPGTTSLFATKNNGFGGTGRAPEVQLAAARAPHREPGQHGQAGPVRLQGPRQRARRHLRLRRVRHDHRAPRAVRQRQGTPSSPTASAPCPTTRTCPARRRTPSSAAPACG